MILRVALPLLALVCLQSPASADYIYDPDVDPVDFECAAALSEAECAKQTRFEAWWREFSDQYDYWYHSLLFSTDVYFDSPASPLPEYKKDVYWRPPSEASPATPHLVDAVNLVALRRYTGGWGFAITDEAQLRMVRRKVDDNLHKHQIAAFREFLPVSLAETAQYIEVFWKFEEADLTKCDGAIEHLLAFPAQAGNTLWSNKQLSWMPGYVEREESEILIVTADGDSIHMRAASREDEGRPKRVKARTYAVYNQSNGGVGYDWAKTMAEIVTPCLKASQATPPWTKLLNANEKARKTGTEKGESR